MSDRPISDDELEDLTAYLDGEAEPAVRDRIAALLKTDPALRAEAEAMQRAWSMLDQLPKPAASADFTQRTMSKLVAVAASSSPSLTLPSAWKRIPWWRVAALLLAGVAGWFAEAKWRRGEPRALRADDPMLVRDLRLIENLPLYLPVETMDYLTSLDHPDRFGSLDAPGN